VNKENSRQNKKVPSGPRVIEISPVASRARMHPRHWGLMLSMAVCVFLPMILSGWYLWARAEDQFVSQAGFTVRREDDTAGANLLGGFAAQLSGGGVGSDNNILYEYIQSQELVSRIDAGFDLRALYAQTWDTDPVFSVGPDATIEDLTWYWRRVVRVAFDQSSGLLELEVRAFEAETAQQIAQAILDESHEMINAINSSARAETIRNASDDLEVAGALLKNAREALIVFRTRTQILDPEMDLAGRLGVVTNLQQQLAAELVEIGLLDGMVAETDQRVIRLNRRIEAIRKRISDERQTVTADEGYPILLADYEGLIVDREFAEESYRAALASLSLATANAQRQSQYLAVFIHPTTAERAEYPHRALLFGLVALFSFLVWAIFALIYYSIRDSR